MDQRAKEAQDVAEWLPATGCADVGRNRVLECLRAADARTLVDATPSSYALFDVLYDYPNNTAGLGSRVRTLLHVDGVTVANKDTNEC